jgi:hypothetical protein
VCAVVGLMAMVVREAAGHMLVSFFDSRLSYGLSLAGANRMAEEMRPSDSYRCSLGIQNYLV